MALSPTYNLTIDVQSNEDYIGDGEFTVTIVDDDRKLINCECRLLNGHLFLWALCKYLIIYFIAHTLTGWVN